MRLPPEPVLEAALTTLHWGLCHGRNFTCQPSEESARRANDLLEALHEIPASIMNWPMSSLEELRTHLADYDEKHWPDGPFLVDFFNARLEELGN